MRNFSKRSAKNAAKFWRNFSQIFVLQFPGKMAAKNFTKNPRHFPRCTKLSFFTAATLGASGPNALFFLYINLRQSRPEALLEGSKTFRESAFSGTFSSPPYVLHPPKSRPKFFRNNLTRLKLASAKLTLKGHFKPCFKGYFSSISKNNLFQQK